MSLETWKEEFYSLPATGLEERDMTGLARSSITKYKNDLDLEATKLSLLKWTGLLPENLEKHGLKWTGNGNIVDSYKEYFIVGASSCHLCTLYNILDGNCAGCPLNDFSNGLQCGPGSAYKNFKSTLNPQFVIDALEGTLKMIEERISS